LTSDVGETPADIENIGGGVDEVNISIGGNGDVPICPGCAGVDVDRRQFGPAESTNVGKISKGVNIGTADSKKGDIIVSVRIPGSREDLTGPLTPTIINGVVFATSSGQLPSDSKLTAAQRAMRSGRAVLYALDGTTGKELWNSGATMTSWATSGALSGGMSQIYVTTYDGTIYTFGFPMEH